jgi:hypothetical protein
MASSTAIAAKSDWIFTQYALHRNQPVPQIAVTLNSFDIAGKTGKIIEEADSRS